MKPILIASVLVCCQVSVPVFSSETAAPNPNPNPIEYTKLVHQLELHDTSDTSNDVKDWSVLVNSSICFDDLDQEIYVKHHDLLQYQLPQSR